MKVRVVVSYHEQRPDSVVDKDGGCCNEHAEAHETVKLRDLLVDTYRPKAIEGEHTILNYLW
jgi:hypothetical protein